ncbi:MAG: 6-phosphogluconolactonase, partial [Pyrinomonadaceae bacterium]|nr:6-phosphogluconolactonase [Pyrinomonadaceae bacterium]
LLAPLGIKPENIFRWRSELKAEIAAEDYETNLRDFFKLENNELPRFDLILLGMGDDGHTASLFPNTKAIHETTRLAVANFVEKFDNFRLTLTPKVLNDAANIMFLIAGKDKAAALREVIKGKREVEKYPSQLINPTNGKLTFLIDTQAAQNLSGQ